MMGSGARLRMQCTTDEDYLEVLELDLWENMQAGTEPQAVMMALGRMRNRTAATERGWKTAKEEIKRNLAARQRVLEGKKN